MYQCIKSFTAKSGVTYCIDEQIDSIKYGLMTYDERWNFRQVLAPVDEDTARTLDFNSEKLDKDQEEIPIFQQNDDDLSFAGFNDGSGGGGGESGSWDNSTGDF